MVSISRMWRPCTQIYIVAISMLVIYFPQLLTAILIIYAHDNNTGHFGYEMDTTLSINKNQNKYKNYSLQC